MRVVLVPGVLALLPEYAGLTDPVAALRSACEGAVAWLVEPGGEVVVRAGPQGERVARALLNTAEVSTRPTDGAGPATATAYLVVGNGSARRGEQAPGHLDERSFGYDDALRAALTAPDPAALTALDQRVGAELLADVASIGWLGGVLTTQHRVVVDYDDDPFGVQYWVMRWTCES